jgi:cyclase
MIADGNIYNMHFGSDAFAFQNAEKLRATMNEAEKILWEELRNKRFLDLKFRRQHPITRFIVDFYCHKFKLVIELYGNIHNLPEVKERDKNREVELKEFGLNILRMKNHEITNDLNAALEKIKDTTAKISQQK